MRFCIKFAGGFIDINKYQAFLTYNFDGVSSDVAFSGPTCKSMEH